jgi:drug/metabolite transporter (DMT)-like permease
MTRQIQGYLFLALAMVLVGTTVIASKIISSGLSPFIATALRFAIAFPVFVAVMRVTRTSWPKLKRRDWSILVIQAAAGSVGYTTLLIWGLGSTSAADAGVILGTLPVVSGAISILVLRERPHPALFLAIALAAAGVLSIVYGPGFGSRQALAGNLLIFAAVVCEGVFILLNKCLDQEIQPVAQATIMTGIGLAATVIPALFEIPLAGNISMASLWSVVYYALIPTVGGFFLWYAGSARVSGAEASVFTACAPISALLLAAAMLGERIGVAQMLGMGCVLGAVLVLWVWNGKQLTENASIPPGDGQKLPP